MTAPTETLSARARARKLREEGLNVRAIATEMGVSVSTAHKLQAPLPKPSRQRRIEAGELVPNTPFRERVEFLQAHDPEFSLNLICERLCYQGVNFEQRRPGRSRNRFHGDTTHLLRVLGMRDQSSSTKRGKYYKPPKRTEYIEYDLAAALCRALDMWPCDCGV